MPVYRRLIHTDTIVFRVVQVSLLSEETVGRKSDRIDLIDMQNPPAAELRLTDVL